MVMEQFIDVLQHYVLPFLFVISVVVFVHEFGHYFVARLCGVKIEAFSIGFGKEIFAWRDRLGTRWRIAWLPLGGYVKMFGDANPASVPGATVHEMTEAEKKVAFYHKHVDKRIAIVAAGPAANYIFAIIVMTVLFMSYGQPFSPPVVNEIVADGAASQSGILVGDRIVEVDGSKTESFEDIQSIMSLNVGTPVKVEVDRNGQPLVFEMTPKVGIRKDAFGHEHKVGQIGIISNTRAYKKRGPFVAFQQAIIESWKLSEGMLRALGQMVNHTRSTEDLGGPLRIVQLSGDAAKEGVGSLIWLMAVISINLGLINLFPVPLLDGGHIVFYIAEKLRGKPLHKDVQEVGFRVGLILIMFLMVFANWNDLVQFKVISYLRSLFS